uniref:20.5 kDa protein n=1 Tax=Grapevine virus B TaxID=35289 RepID=A0A2S1FYK4_9VIRU|nr:20.5 kDa protein [Grapevine virus B]
MNQNSQRIEHEGLRRLLRQVEGFNLDVNVLSRDYNKLGLLEAQQYRILSLLCRINKVSVSFVVSCLIRKECVIADYREGLVCLRLEEVIELLVSGSLPSVFSIRKDFEKGSVAFYYPWYYTVTREPGSRLQYPFRNYVPGLKERITALPWVALGFKASAANKSADPGSHSYTIECVRQA